MATARSELLRSPLDVSPDQLAKRIGRWTQPAFLEGGPGLGEAGRWSILAAFPSLTFQATGTTWSIHERRVRRSGDRPLDALDRLLRELGLADPTERPDPELPPFQGGLIGLFGYDLAPRLEQLPRKAPRDSRIPDIRFALYETFVTIDHHTGAVELWSADLHGCGSTALRNRHRTWRDRLNRSESGLLSTIPTPLPSPVSNFERPAYLDAIRQALEYIAAGDIFQVNLSQRFETQGSFCPLDLYLRLKQRSPAPFSAFLRWGNLAVISASPEWFYQTRGDRIVTRPIKGTRPRGSSPEADVQLANELRASPKDRAELTMIVDLERNDLGRVCRFGTVQVTEPLTVESFAQVHHLVATVEGRLRSDVGPIDVVRAIFPGGSITGAPKIRAMEIIDELEPTRRSVYTGSIGYFSRGGTSAFNIAIRTMTAERDRVRYQVGGGIVADSDPEAEYEETLHKGRGLKEVLEGWAPLR